ncbi:PQQ-binding-like beta-propeller repeat protein [Halobacteriovorax sp. GB3]|uniref:outer membrane protein assembly factor BamB family protein n=1 Tax=Halobacteriovorax sp. GB3 TaxID=2719615 RepID=UPI0023618931|nr:PQQ-binding-like beta-propeller repeat protein [Halobacteriovorax sp. GB3]MDD0853252.1 PQQ-binding-like beta-propeller repeat protein [Halobacteriovorax sp. GB3]
MLKFIGPLALLIMAGCSKLPAKYTPSAVKDDLGAFHVSWTKNLDPVYETGNLPISLNSPLIHGELLYLGDASGTMSAYNLSNGRIVWKTKDNGAYFSRPVVFNDNLVYGNVQGRLYSRNLMTGKLDYEVDLGASVETRPFIHKGRLFAQTRDHKIFSLDAKTGKVLWAYKRSVPFLTTLQRASRPVVIDNKLFVGFADGSIVAFGPEDGVVLWEKRIATGTKFVDVDTDPVLFNGHLIVGSITGDLVVLSPEYGQVLRRLPYSISREVYVDGKNLVVLTSNGEVVLLDEFYNEKKKLSVSKEALSSLVKWKGGYAISSVGKKLYYVKSDLLKVEQTYSLGSEYSAIFGELVQADERLAAFSSRNRLYVFK